MINSRTNADQERLPLWSIFLAGPVVYSVYFVASYVLSEFGCLAGYQQVIFLGVNVVRLGVVFFTVVAAGAMVVISALNFRHWRALRAGPDDPNEDDPIFMLFVGLWLNVFFTVVIVLSVTPLLLGSACDWI